MFKGYTACSLHVHDLFIEFGFCLTFGYHVRKNWDPFWQCKWFLFGAGWFWLTGLLDGGCGAAGMNEF